MKHFPFSGFFLIRNTFFIIFLGIAPIIGLAFIGHYLIVSKYGTLQRFLKQLFTSKKPIPTVSESMTQQQQLQNINVYFTPNGNITNSLPLLITETEQVTYSNITMRNGLSSSVQTFLKRISFARRSSANNKVDKPKEVICDNEVVYANLQGINSQINVSDLYAFVNKTKTTNKETSNSKQLQKPKEPNISVNQKGISKSVTRISKHSNNSEEDKTVTESSYEEFAKRKKKVGMSPSTLNHQKQLETRKVGDGLRPASSSSQSGNTKLSVRDMIKNFDRRNC